uniref:cellulase n=1 Tax=Xylophaga rikuzenica TaxID=2028187 RepID=A0A455XCK1_9BIVA|nr:GH9 cellulase [Xylophaga rikuzenica]
MNMCCLTVCLLGLLWSVSTVSGAGTTSSPPPGAITPGPATYDSSTMKYDYGKALGLSILFYDAQRAGKLPANNPIAWRSDSVLYDYDDDGWDLTGGWFDAGDHTKFSLPMSFATWVLNWGFLKFEDGYSSTGQKTMMCDMIRWPLEYFLKCWRPDLQVLYAEIGDTESDQNRWASPENLNMERPAHRLNASCPGSDVAGDMASAMASGYLVFKNICPNAKAFADKLLVAAKGIYKFGIDNRGLYSDCIPDGPTHYKSTHDHDELAAAGAWLYKATGETDYLDDAKGFASPRIPWAFSWNQKGPGVNLLLYEATEEDIYLQATKDFMDFVMPGGNVSYTPCGLVFRNQWGSNRFAANMALIALMAAEHDIMPEEYKTWALSQINYMLGDNNYNLSYEIGFGDNYPTHYHHRASSCIAEFLDCDYDTPDDNPNILYGGLVGGPLLNDTYADVRSDNVQNEVSVDYNSGFQSSLAALVHFANHNALPASPPRKCTARSMDSVLGR